jgi:hypothetical protein
MKALAYYVTVLITTVKVLLYSSQIAELTLLLLLLDTQINDSDIQHFAILSSAVQSVPCST